MADNEVLAEEHPFGIEPETYSELEANHPKLYKNTESGTSPVKNPFDDKGSVEIKSFKVNIGKNKYRIMVQGGIAKLKKKPRIVKAHLHHADEVGQVSFYSSDFMGHVYWIFDNIGYYYSYYPGSTTSLDHGNSKISFGKDENAVWINLRQSSVYFYPGEWEFYYVEGEEDW